MANLKRKFNELEYSDSDSEEPTFGKQILPVADLPDDFSGEPIDGMQYLFTVRRDAKALPYITRAVNPYERNAIPSAPKAPRQDPHSALPSSEWREIVETRWKNLRKNFNQPTIGTYPSWVAQQKLMPDKKERDLWWEFLSGKPESIWSCPRQRSKKELKQVKRQQKQHEKDLTQGDHGREDEDRDQEKSQPGQVLRLGDLDMTCTSKNGAGVENSITYKPQGSLPTPGGTPAPSDDNTLTGATRITGQNDSEETPTQREPTPKLLKLIDERMALHLLMYFNHWITLYLQGPGYSKFRPTNTHARWIFALLLRIDDYVSADDMNLLRNLARTCLSLLKFLISGRTNKMPSMSDLPVAGIPETMDEQAGWTIISAIISLWGQKDLWMDAEETLASI